MKYNWRNILLVIIAILVAVVSVINLVWTYQAQQKAKAQAEEIGEEVTESFLWPYLINVTGVLGSLVLLAFVMYDIVFGVETIPQISDKLKKMMKRRQMVEA